MKFDPVRITATRVLVAGDVMLDRYWSGAASRISPEAPVPVVHVTNIEERPGGAANVALNIAALGGQISLLGVIGDDEAGAALERLLDARRVTCLLQRSEQAVTCTKFRILSQHQQLLRVDMERGLHLADQPQLLAQVERQLAGCAVLVLSDYGKGTLADPQALIRAATRLGKPVLVDPKGSDFSKYRGATLITPNRAEFEAVVGPCADEAALVTLGTALMHDLGLQALLITRGEQGMTLLRHHADPHHLPTHAREVYDVTGAGDTVIATLAAALGAGYSLPEAANLANVAAGLVVAKLGTATTTPAELVSALAGTDEPPRGVLAEDKLAQIIARARTGGERIVMTNGCFDLLHAGHVAYLEQARALGDRLIVAVNDDASVRGLKGDNRPVQPLSTRMAVLSALRAVDWVVPFSEPTPERLYCRLLPDILVKGGDYAPSQLAGADCVSRNGGEVRILDFVPGESTTATIGRIHAAHATGATARN